MKEIKSNPVKGSTTGHGTAAFLKKSQVASSIEDFQDALSFLDLSMIKTFYSKGEIVLFQVIVQYLAEQVKNLSGSVELMYILQKTILKIFF